MVGLLSCVCVRAFVDCRMYGLDICNMIQCIGLTFIVYVCVYVRAYVRVLEYACV